MEAAKVLVPPHTHLLKVSTLLPPLSHPHSPALPHSHSLSHLSFLLSFSLSLLVLSLTGHLDDRDTSPSKPNVAAVSTEISDPQLKAE